MNAPMGLAGVIVCWHRYEAAASGRLSGDMESMTIESNEFKKKPKTQRRPNHVRTRTSKRAVLKSARKLFVRKGYRRTTMDEIARSAGLSKGGIYFHFDDKLSILRDLLGQFSEQIEPVLNEMRDEQVDPKARLIAYHNWISRKARTDPEELLLPIPIYNEFLGEAGIIPEILELHYNAMTAALQTVFADGQALGIFTSRSSPHNLAVIIMALQDGILLQWLRRQDEIDGESLVRALRHFILQGSALLSDETGSPLLADGKLNTKSDN